MAKMIDKHSLRFKKGYVINEDNEVIALPDGVAEQLNALEKFLQQQEYLAGQPKATGEPSLDGFEFKSTVEVPRVKVDTPILDLEVEKSGRILDEIRKSEMAKAVNEMIANFDKAFVFMKEDMFIEGTKVEVLDLATIGNPLKADPDKIIDRIVSYAMGSIE